MSRLMLNVYQTAEDSFHVNFEHPLHGPLASPTIEINRVGELSRSQGGNALLQDPNLRSQCPPPQNANVLA